MKTTKKGRELPRKWQLHRVLEEIWGLFAIVCDECGSSEAKREGLRGHPAVREVWNSGPWKCLTYRPARSTVFGAVVAAYQSRHLLSAVILETSCVQPASALIGRSSLDCCL